MFSWIFHFSGLVTSWYLIDLTSRSVLENTVYPLLFIVFLIILVVKVALRPGANPSNNVQSSGASGYYGGDSCGGGDC